MLKNNLFPIFCINDHTSDSSLNLQIIKTSIAIWWDNISIVKSLYDILDSLCLFVRDFKGFNLSNIKLILFEHLEI